MRGLGGLLDELLNLLAWAASIAAMTGGFIYGLVTDDYAQATFWIAAGLALHVLAWVQDTARHRSGKY